ncbi:MAG: hypothetical protein HC769_26030 [Cyanobacteria bacterium CRU_2_1]|nr:hypothetical protein [Cyanobacteria bacterium CRU_2_1]
MRKINGLALVAIGLLHTLIALIMPGTIGFAGIWQEIANVGVVDAVKSESLNPTAVKVKPCGLDTLANWTFWNHVRTIAALASAAAITLALHDQS